MKINRVCAVYFSAVKSTRFIVEKLAKEIAEKLSVGTESIDFTLPSSRTILTEFDSETLVVFGTPTYAGRVPNKVLPFVQNLFKGNNTPTVPIVTFGNRSYDSALTELCNELKANQFVPFAAGAFVCGHVMSDRMAPGRPDAEDLEKLSQLADAAVSALTTIDSPTSLSWVIIKNDEPVGPYYTPLGKDGKPAKFLKAKPKVDMEKCDACGLCAAVCPLGSINPENVSEVPGICIKCHACIRKCPKSARFFDDEALLSHVAMLDELCQRRAETEIFTTGK